MAQLNNSVPSGEFHGRADSLLREMSSIVHQTQYRGFYNLEQATLKAYPLPPVPAAPIVETAPTQVAAAIVAETVAPVIPISAAPSYETPTAVAAPRPEVNVQIELTPALDVDDIRAYINSISLDAESERPEVLHDEAA